MLRHAILTLSTRNRRYSLVSHECFYHSQRAATLSQCVPLRHTSWNKRRALRFPCRFPTPYELSAPVPGRRHLRRLAAAQVLVLGRVPRRGAAADLAARPRRHRGDLHPGQPRRDVPCLAGSDCSWRPGDRRHPVAAGSRARHRRGQASAGDARRRVRQRGALRKVPRIVGRRCVHRRTDVQPLVQRAAPTAGLSRTGRSQRG